MKSIRIGSGAGFSGDRIEPAVLLAEKGNLNYLVLECLAERTIALAQKRKLANPSEGYDPLLVRRISPLLKHINSQKIRLITNMGAANPLAAAQKIKALCKEQQLDLKVAAVLGDDVSAWVLQHQNSLNTLEASMPLSQYEIISANAYIGAEGVVRALEAGADIIITGRVADPSLFLAPMMFEFAWSETDWERLGRGTIVGHLLECAGQLTGGYFANTSTKIVPNLAHIGFPFADVQENGLARFGKVLGTGGRLDLATVKEQLLYEVINPLAYLTPDVSADFTAVELNDLGNNEVELLSGTGNARPEHLKVSVGYRAFFQGEGEISYGGSDAMERGKLAGEIIRERLVNQFPDIRIEWVGVNSLFQGTLGDGQPTEVRLRVVAKAETQAKAQQIGEEVEALYTNGPAGGGGVRKQVIEQVGIVSVLIPREVVQQELVII